MDAGSQSALEIRRETLAAAAAGTLIRALNAELEARYPEEGANHFRLDPEEVAAGRGAFLIAYQDGEPVGCGAVRRIDGPAAELKRMYVVPARRGHGVGGALLAALEAEGRRLGAVRLVLETGARQTEAVALYTRAGFAPIPAWGEYVDSPLSLCLGKELG